MKTSLLKSLRLPLVLTAVLCGGSLACTFAAPVQQSWADPEPDQGQLIMENDSLPEGETPDSTTDGTENTFPAKGWVIGEDNSRYYYDGASQDPQTGWLSLNGQTYYLQPSKGGAAATGLFTVDGSLYGADPQGALYKSQWGRVDGRYYWFNALGKPLDGWLYYKGGRYYLDPADQGAMVTGWRSLNNAWYYFQKNGAMLTGWLPEGSTWYYLQNDGTMATGWQKVGGTWYHLNATGALDTGWLRDAGQWYYLKKNGAMATSWEKVGGTWYHLGKSGAMDTGWLQDAHKWYYLKDNGAMKTGWLRENGTWYFLDRDTGAMKTGTQQADGKTYYFTNSGAWSDDYGMTNRAQQYSSPSQYLILIDCYHNVFGVYQGYQNHWNRLHYWQCSTGMPGLPTVKGVFHAGIKGLSFGNGFTCWYYTQILGDYLIHSGEYYQGTFIEMDNRMGVNISHGCVRLLLNNAKWVYDNVPSGTTIVTY